MSLLVILLLLPCCALSTREFDNYLSTYDSFIRLWVYGYHNEGNQGFIRRCCRLRSTTTGCTPCKYNVVMRFRQSDSVTFTIDQIFYPVGTYSTASEFLFETFYFEKMYSWFNVYTYDVNYYVNELPSRIIDVYDMFSYVYYGNVEFDGVLGRNNYIKCWYAMSLERLSLSSIRNLNLIIQSVYFENYQLSSGKCCVTPTEDEDDTDCFKPCSFKAGLYSGLSNFEFATSRIIKGSNSSKFYKYNLSLTYDSAFYESYGRSIRIRFTTESNEDIDRIEIPFRSFYKFNTYAFNNILGTNGNVRVNFTTSLYCRQYGGTYCINSCNSFKNVETCDTFDGRVACLNGATDLKKCENFTLSCNVNPCRNNGTCKFFNNMLTCSCQSGYRGKYCETPECLQNCNSRGLCVGPNRCICDHPFFGPDCQLEQCNKTTAEICKNNGICYFENSEPKCNCDEIAYTGRYCHIPLCDGRCENGICSQDGNKHRCVCYDGFEGDLCEFKAEKIFVNTHNLLVPTVIALVVCSSLMLVLILLKYYNLLFFRVQQKSIINHHDDE